MTRPTVAPGRIRRWVRGGVRHVLLKEKIAMVARMKADAADPADDWGSGSECEVAVRGDRH